MAFDALSFGDGIVSVMSVCLYIALYYWHFWLCPPSRNRQFQLAYVFFFLSFRLPAPTIAGINHDAEGFVHLSQPGNTPLLPTYHSTCIHPSFLSNDDWCSHKKAFLYQVKTASLNEIDANCCARNGAAGGCACVQESSAQSAFRIQLINHNLSQLSIKWELKRTYTGSIPPTRGYITHIPASFLGDHNPGTHYKRPSGYRIQIPWVVQRVLEKIKSERLQD